MKAHAAERTVPLFAHGQPPPSAAPRERPILFSGPMVRAILEGRKTQTRRVLRFSPQPAYTSSSPLIGAYDAAHATVTWSMGTNRFVQPCPYGRPGDTLWVRETFGTLTGNGHRTVYRADRDPPLSRDGTEVTRMVWTPSIFMRPAACRLRLEVTAVRVERLQDISEDDAVAEGVAAPGAPVRFMSLWDRINGKRAPWASNPWVWCVSFRRLP